jgi:hypothetical protein
MKGILIMAFIERKYFGLTRMADGSYHCGVRILVMERNRDWAKLVKVKLTISSYDDSLIRVLSLTVNNSEMVVTPMTLKHYEFEVLSNGIDADIRLRLDSDYNNSEEEVQITCMAMADEVPF